MLSFRVYAEARTGEKACSMKPSLVITVALTFLFVAYVDAQAQSPLDVQQVLGLVRTLNTIQVTIAMNTKAYGSQADMLTGPCGLGPFLKARSADIGTFEWEKDLNLSSNEVLPGWTLDFALVGKGYRLILTGKDDVLITDEIGVIYRAVTMPLAPRAAQLKSAKDFPGAIAHNLWREKSSSANQARTACAIGAAFAPGFLTLAGAPVLPH
jgi:hypothetical protein